MKVSLKYFLFLFSVYIFSGCEDPLSPPPVRASLRQEFTLEINQAAVVEGENLRIKFLSVPEDTRCLMPDPPCPGIGNARVVLRLLKDNVEAIDTLNTDIMPVSSYTYWPLIIRLIKLEPVRQLTETLKPVDYRATLIVTYPIR